MKKEIVRTKDFILTPHELTGMQDKLISAVQTKIKLNTDIDFVDFTLPEIADIMQIKITNYERFRQLFQAVKTIELSREEGDTVTLDTLFGKITWDKKKGFIRFFFSELAKDNFIRINGKPYAAIGIIIATFKSDYAVKVYQLASLLKNRRFKSQTYTIQEFRNLLNISDKYHLASDFRKRVLEPAVKEINDKTEMKIEIRTNKTGRSITSITLKIISYKKLDDTLSTEQNTLEKASKVLKICLEDYNFTSDQAMEIMNKYPQKLFFQVNYQIKNSRGTSKEVKNPLGYFWAKYHERVRDIKNETNAVQKELEMLKNDLKKNAGN